MPSPCKYATRLAQSGPPRALWPWTVAGALSAPQAVGPGEEPRERRHPRTGAEPVWANEARGVWWQVGTGRGWPRGLLAHRLRVGKRKEACTQGAACGRCRKGQWEAAHPSLHCLLQCTGVKSVCCTRIRLWDQDPMPHTAPTPGSQELSLGIGSHRPASVPEAAFPQRVKQDANFQLWQHC